MISCLPARADENDLKLNVVCIDAGHGGKDAGCVSRDRKTYEKNIVLSIATKLRDRIKAEYPDVKVVMTRSDDRFIALDERAKIANRNHADLFISIHINATDKGTGPNGYSTHVLGQFNSKHKDMYQSNMELTKRENSVILLEEDYSTTYQGFDPGDPESFIFFNLMQNAHLEQSLELADLINRNFSGGPIRNSRGISQDAFLVLWKTTMPSVLIECGFITNPNDLAAIRSESGRNKIAESIFRGFSEFKRKYDGSVNLSDEKKPDAQAPARKDTPEVSESSVFYGTQILASSKKMSPDDKFFKGYTPHIVWTGKLYKYIIGTSESLSEAKTESKEIIKKFPGSFVVRAEGDNVVIAR